ncbi:MAG: PQQ-binding-like beta-propeller repeat protein [Thermoguttaceae bacterium]
MRSCVLRLGGGLLAWFLGAVAPAADWPQWRGPNRDGSIPAAAVPAAWPKQLQRQWRIEVGEGHASPVVSGPRVFLLSRQGDEEVVRAVALDDGRPLWSRKYPAPYDPSPYAAAHGKGPRSTPAVAGQRLITVGVGSIVSCWDTVSGNLLWQRDFAKDFKPPSSLFYGMSVSPMILHERAIVYVGVSGDGALMALNLETGRTEWAWKRDGPGYASPILVTLAGVPQLVLQSQRASIGIDPADGKLLWSIPLETRYDQNIITPVAVGDLVILAGLSNPTTAYRFEHSGDRWTPKQVWRNEAISLYMSSPVAVGKLLFGLAERNKGQLFCLDAASGKTLWTNEGRTGDNAALLAAGKAVLALTSQSELIVFKAQPDEFDVLAKYAVSDAPTWAHPAVAGGRILIKDRSELMCWSLEP